MFPLPSWDAEILVLGFFQSPDIGLLVNARSHICGVITGGALGLVWRVFRWGTLGSMWPGFQMVGKTVKELLVYFGWIWALVAVVPSFSQNFSQEDNFSNLSKVERSMTLASIQEAGWSIIHSFSLYFWENCGPRHLSRHWPVLSWGGVTNLLTLFNASLLGFFWLWSWAEISLVDYGLPERYSSLWMNVLSSAFREMMLEKHLFYHFADMTPNIFFLCTKTL